MSTGLDGGGRGGVGSEFFLSAHRCPGVDVLPHHNSEKQIPPPCSRLSAVKRPEFTCTGQSEANYLDVSSTCHSGKEEEEEEEGSISEWSEEDLSMHFSPSVILPSDDEESDPESGFECVDFTVETLVKGHEEEGLKMVPKRQIRLKKKDADYVVGKEKTGKLQVIPKEEPAERRLAHSEANDMLHPITCHRPDLLLRQHSMPASLQTHSTTGSAGDSYGVYKGLVAGASQAFHVGGNSRQRLQKSFSLDETKTKMASCIIKSVLSKKMQVEQNNCKTSYLQRKPAVLAGLPQPADQQRVREGVGCKTGGGMFKTPVHVVRDMRSVVKNTYSLSFSTAPTTTPENNKPTSFKVIGQEESPPPTYQQAVGAKGHDETKNSCHASVHSSSSRGHATKVIASLSQSQDRKQSYRLGRPITQQRRGSEPIINRSKLDDVIWPVVLLDPPTNSPVSTDPSELSKSERGRGVSHQAVTSNPPSVLIQPPPHPPSTSRHHNGSHPLLSAEEESSTAGVTSQFAPTSSHPCSSFYTPTALPASPSTLRTDLEKVCCMQRPLSYNQTQLQPPPPAPTLPLLRRSEESQRGSTGNTSDQPDYFIKTCLPHQSRTTGDQESVSNTVTPATQEQPEQQKNQEQLQHQQFLRSVPRFLPAQVGSDFLVNIAGSAAGPGTFLSGPAPYHIMLDSEKGRCFYVDRPPQPQRKLLLDPETGQYVHVFLPAPSSTPNTGMFPVRCVNPTPFAPSVINPAPAVISVMQFQPTVAVSSLYGPHCLPFTLHTPSVNFTHTAP